MIVMDSSSSVYNILKSSTAIENLCYSYLQNRCEKYCPVLLCYSIPCIHCISEKIRGFHHKKFYEIQILWFEDFNDICTMKDRIRTCIRRSPKVLDIPQSSQSAVRISILKILSALIAEIANAATTKILGMAIMFFLYNSIRKIKWNCNLSRSDDNL